MKTNARIRLFYAIFLGVFTVVVGILFLAQAADIYFSGVRETGASQGMYSRAAVGERLRLLYVPLLLWAVAIVEGAVVYVLFPVSPSRVKGLPPEKLYARLLRRAEPGKDPEAYAALRRAERVRLGVRIFTGAFCLLAVVMCIVYLADASHFTSLSALNGEVLAMVANVLPWTGAALVLLALEAVFEGAYAKKQLPAVKRLAGAPVPAKAGALRRAAEDGRVLLGVRVAIFALALLFLILGALNGGARDVFVKAINICTECIGLG